MIPGYSTVRCVVVFRLCLFPLVIVLKERQSLPRQHKLLLQSSSEISCRIAIIGNKTKQRSLLALCIYHSRH